MTSCIFTIFNFDLIINEIMFYKQLTCIQVSGDLL